MLFTRHKAPSPRKPFRPLLERLEDRLTPTTTAMAAASGGGMPPPSQTQAVISLFLDGAAVELENLAEQFAANIDAFPLPTSQATAKAAAAGIDYNAVLSLSQALFQLTGHSASNALADAQQNAPFAGSLALSALQAGEQAAQQAVRLS